jgi:hypothetical protein
MPSSPARTRSPGAIVSPRSLGDAYRALRLLIVAWVAFALLGTAVGAFLLAPAVVTDTLPIERADFVSTHVARVRLGAVLFAARGLGEVFACLGLVAFARRFPFQPGLVAATIAACAAIAALSVDGSGAYLLGHALPAAAGAASGQGGGLDLPDAGGFLGQLADLIEQLAGYGQQTVLRDYLRIEALALRRIGSYGTILHMTADIAIFAAAASYAREKPGRALTAATFFAVLARAVAAGGIYAAVRGAGFGYPHLALGITALLIAPFFDLWLASAVRARIEAASAQYAGEARAGEG